MKKFLLGLLCFTFLFNLAGCTDSQVNIGKLQFEIDKAKETAKAYMISLSQGDSDKANSYCKDIKISANELEKAQNNKINSFKIDRIIEKADYAYINYKVARGNDEDVTAELDEISLKIEKEEENYLITNVHCESLKQVYRSGDTLRIREESTGKSQLLLKMKELPRQIYPKRNEVVINKEDVPIGTIDKVSIGFQGERIAMSLNDGSNTAIIMAMIKQSEPAVAGSGENDNEKQSNDNTENLDELVEKSIVGKTTGYDILSNSTVNKILFSDDVGELIVQISTEGQGDSIKVYKNPDGSLLELQLDKIFPPTQYSVDVLRITEEGTIINVEPIVDGATESGEYIVDFNKQLVKRNNS